MRDPCNGNLTTPATQQTGEPDLAMAADSGTPRRDFLKAGAALMAGGAAAQMLPGNAQAQTTRAADPAAELRRLQGQRRLLLKGGVVLSMDPRVGDFAQADVLIEDGKIREVRPNIAVAADAAGVIDATNTIVSPGFVDTHHHFYQGLLRNILTNGLLNPDYNRDIGGTLTPAYQPADVYAGTLVTALGMIDRGTTAAVDTSQVCHSPEHSDACVRALQESGMRVVYAYWRGEGPAAQYPRDILRIQRTYFNSADQLLTLAMGSTLDAEIFAFAREVGVPTVSHGINNNTEATLMALARDGLIGPDSEYIHCTHLSDDAWRLIRDTGGHVSLAVPIEMAMGHGRPPIQEALDHGVRPSLSSDVDATMSQDPFTIMRAAFTLQRLQLLQRARNGEQDLPPLLTCKQVLEFATLDGARCAHLDHKVGSLTPGKEADVVLLRASRLNVWPLNNAPGAVVNTMDPSNVDTVLIGGQLRKWRGSLVGVDEARIIRLVQEARDAVIRRSGFQLDLLS